MRRGPRPWGGTAAWTSTGSPRLPGPTSATPCGNPSPHPTRTARDWRWPPTPWSTTATLHFTHVLHDSDTVMALGLTTLTVGYDAVIAICRTWHKTSPASQLPTRQESPGRRTAA